MKSSANGVRVRRSASPGFPGGSKDAIRDGQIPGRSGEYERADHRREVDQRVAVGPIGHGVR